MFDGKYFLVLRSDPNYSGAAILMATLFLFYMKKIKLSHLIIVNILFFLLLFSRTALFTMLLFLISYPIAYTDISNKGNQNNILFYDFSYNTYSSNTSQFK